jgi:serine protease Do
MRRSCHLLTTALLFLGALPAFADSGDGARSGNPRRSPIVEVAERARAAVVNIHSERSVQGPVPQEMYALVPSQHRVNGMGTGIVIDPRGYLITNHHVVDDVHVLRVRLSDGTSTSARVLARDAETDLALLKIDVGRMLPTIPLGTATDLMVGETVIAIGNAYGYEHTVTAGVVSAVSRDVTITKDVSYKALIQTDASMNPGNSGGPLLNVNGEIVGVNVAIRAGAQGIGFAIPVDTVLRVAAEMVRRQRPASSHGLGCRDRVDLLGEVGGPVLTSASNATSPRRSLVIERVESSSAAAKAGLQAGDVLLTVGDVHIAHNLDLERAFLDSSSGKSVNVTVRRGGEEKRFELVLQTPAMPTAADVVWRKLGIRASAVAADQVNSSNPQLHGGLTIAEVQPGGIAARAGLQRGDVLVGLHQWETLSVDNVAFVVAHPELATFQPVRFYILRAGQVHRGWLPQMD